MFYSTEEEILESKDAMNKIELYPFDRGWCELCNHSDASQNYCSKYNGRCSLVRNCEYRPEKWWQKFIK